MKKYNIALIGQGRSGKNIHGKFLRSDGNQYFIVKYVVETDEARREKAKDLYPGCETFSDYRDLYQLDDIDLVVNTSCSEMHYEITKDLLNNGLNVLVEKPFARNRFECETLIRIAKEKGLLLTVFQQSFFAPHYTKACEVIQSGVLGEIKQINIQYNGFARRWDWQTLQKRMGGSAYNTGPHPIGLALGFLDFDKNAQVVYSRLDKALTCGDAEDCVKILLTAPGKPLVDVEINSTDAYADYNLKIQGSRGTFVSTLSAFKYKYIANKELTPRAPIENFIQAEDGEPIYCSEKLDIQEVTGNTDVSGAFNIAVSKFYEELYYAIDEGRPLSVTAEMATEIIAVIDKCHVDNPMPILF